MPEFDPKGFFTSVDNAQTSLDTAQALAQVQDQSSQDKAVAALTQACKIVAGFGFGAESIYLAPVVWANRVALANQINQSCSLVSLSVEQNFQTEVLVVKTLLAAQQQIIQDTEQNSIYGSILDKMSLGDTAGTISLSNQLLKIPSADQPNITFSNDGSFTASQQSPGGQDWVSYAATLSPNYELTTLTINNSDNTSSIITRDPDSSSTTTEYSGPNGTGPITRIDRENNDSTSQITTFNPNDGSSTTTYYSDPNGTGSVTKIDQENPDDTSKITTFGLDGPVTTTYTGPNGTGRIIEIDINKGGSTITSQVIGSTYTYLGQDLTESTSHEDIGPITASVTLNTAGDAVFYSASADGATLTYGPNGGQVFDLLNLQFTVKDNQIIGWFVESGGFVGAQHYEINFVEYAPGAGGDAFATGSGVNAGNSAPGTWTLTGTSTAETISPAAGQTLELADVLNNQDLVSQGNVQSLTIDGPGTVEVTGVAVVPDLFVFAPGNVALHGGSIITDPITVDAGGNISGYGLIAGDETLNGTITAIGGTLDLTGNITGSGTLTLAPGAQLQLEGTVGAGLSLSFTGADEALIVGPSAIISAPIIGFGDGDEIVLEGHQAKAATYDAGTKTLTIGDESDARFVLTMSGTYQQSDFRVTDGMVEFANPVTPPTPTGLNLELSSDSGLKGDGITNVTPPLIIGFGEAGDTVTLFDGNIPIGTGTVGTDGSWSVTPTSPLADGPHELTATETNTTANTSVASSPLDLTIKTSTPAPSGLALASAADSGTSGDNLTNVTAPTIIGFGEAGDIVTLFDGNTAIGAGVVAADGSWSVTPTSPLAAGRHELTATETDVAANTSVTSSPLDLTIKSSAPAPSGLELATASDSGVQGDNVTDVIAPTIIGFGEVGDSVTLLDGNTPIGTGAVAADGTWSITPINPLDVGRHTLTAIETDGAANTSAASSPLSLTIEDSASHVGPSGPDQFFYTGSDSQNVLGTSGDDTIWGNTNNSRIDGLTGNNTLGVQGNGNEVLAGNGNDLLIASGSGNLLDGGDGADSVIATGDHDTIDGGAGDDFLVLTGNFGSVHAGLGNDQVFITGDNDTVSLDDGNNLLAIAGNNDWVDLGSGNDTVYASGNDLTIGSGAGAGLVYLSGSNATFLDQPSLYNDTVVGFSASAGDRIKLTTDAPANALAHSSQINGGLDTLIALADGSTILLKYVSHIDAGFLA